MQVSPIDKPTETTENSAFKKMMSHSSHKHYELLTFRDAARLIYQREGLLGYYRGFMPSMIKNTMNAATYFSSLHHFKMAL